ncbi:MAG TPA: hypothetical protein VM490_04135 [Armatimonadaceae bacterium]|nr:hypothetical protein [Armatimonadaceae bacterium]
MPNDDRTETTLQSPGSAPSGVVLTWRVHRLREEPWRLGIVLVAYGVALLLWLVLFPHPLTLLLPVVGLTSAMREYLFPQEFRLTREGAYVANGPARLFLAWDEVKRATHGSDGVHLSPFARPTRLDAFRGVRLDFADGNDAAVLAAVRVLWRPAREATP